MTYTNNNSLTSNSIVNDYSGAQRLIDAGYDSCKKFTDTLDAYGHAAVCAAADQAVALFGALLGSAGGGVASIVGKVDSFASDRLSGNTVAKGEAQLALSKDISKSPSLEIVQQAQMAIGVPNRFQVTDVGQDYGFAPSATPGVGMNMGQGYAIG